MPHTITAPRRVARAATIALWAVGSAYLLRHEWQAASPDWVVICATPVVWGVILALPVLSTYARHDRMWLATALLWLAAIMGSIYTLNATIGRQAGARDAAVQSATVIEQQRAALTVALDAEKLRRQDALNRCGTGRACHESTRSLLGMHQLEIERLERQIAGLTVAAPQAGEQRVAAILSLVFGVDATFAADLVALLPLAFSASPWSCPRLPLPCTAGTLAPPLFSRLGNICRPWQSRKPWQTSQQTRHPTPSSMLLSGPVGH